MGHISFWSTLICNFIGGKHKYHKEKHRSFIRSSLWGTRLEVNGNKTMYVPLYCHQSAAQNHNVKIINGYSEKCGEVQIFGTKAASQIRIHEETKLVFLSLCDP
jgi:hypothetical protein